MDHPSEEKKRWKRDKIVNKPNKLNKIRRNIKGFSIHFSITSKVYKNKQFDKKNCVVTHYIPPPLRKIIKNPLQYNEMCAQTFSRNALNVATS